MSNVSSLHQNSLTYCKVLEVDMFKNFLVYSKKHWPKCHFSSFQDWRTRIASIPWYESGSWRRCSSEQKVSIWLSFHERALVIVNPEGLSPVFTSNIKRILANLIILVPFFIIKTRVSTKPKKSKNIFKNLPYS